MIRHAGDHNRQSGTWCNVFDEGDSLAGVWREVDCRHCLRAGRNAGYNHAAERLAELYRAHGLLEGVGIDALRHERVAAVAGPTGDIVGYVDNGATPKPIVATYNVTCEGDPDRVVRKTREALESVVKKGATVTINVNANEIKKAIDNRLQPLLSLLTRCSDFIANLPPGALDRRANVEAMEIRRAIADAIVPADKECAK